jgi:hypothetical protein
VDGLTHSNNAKFFAFGGKTVNDLKNIDIDKQNAKLTQLCVEYAAKYIPLITQKQIYKSDENMKKTDLLCMDIDPKLYSQYKKKKKLTNSSKSCDIMCILKPYFQDFYCIQISN